LIRVPISCSLARMRGGKSHLAAALGLAAACPARECASQQSSQFCLFGTRSRERGAVRSHPDGADQSGLAPENLTTSAHFSVSSCDELAEIGGRHR
jgi:hypothetical protein